MDLTNEFRVGVPVERAWEVLTDVERIAPCMPGAQLQEIEGDEYRGIVKVKVGPITAQYKGAARFVEQDEAGHRAVLRAEGRETRGQGNANATITAQLEPDGDGTQVSVMTDLTITGRVAQFGRGVLADVSAKLLGQFADCLQTQLLAGDESGATAGGADGGSSASAASAPSASAAGGPRDIASEGAAATLQDVPQDATWPGQAAPSGPTAKTAEAATASSGDADRARANGTSGPSIRVVDSAEPEPVDLLEAAGAPVAKRLAPAVIGLTILWLLSIFLRRRRRR
ncbi:MAG TPA: SRPBCC family protein [Acidimicrobiales bacterium]|nr:SRPBCC family protein [Acidimicrobiales bacterium]